MPAESSYAEAVRAIGKKTREASTWRFACEEYEELLQEASRELASVQAEALPDGPRHARRVRLHRTARELAERCVDLLKSGGSPEELDQVGGLTERTAALLDFDFWEGS